MPLRQNLAPTKRRGGFCPDHVDPKADLKKRYAEKLGLGMKPRPQEVAWQFINNPGTLVIADEWANIYTTTQFTNWQATYTNRWDTTEYTTNLYTGATNVTNDQVWSKWIRPRRRIQWYTPTTYTLTGNVEWHWMDEPTGIVQQGRDLITPEEMERQRREREAFEEERRQRAQVAREAREAAQARAFTLLRHVLTEEQEKTLERHGWFMVRGSHGGVYRINARGQSGNVDLMNAEGRRQAALCAHTTGVPDPDAWLAQMLEITHDEIGWLAVANIHAGSLPPELGQVVRDRRYRRGVVGAAA